MSKIKKPKEELIQTLLVTTPLGRLLLANKEIGDYEIKIGEVTIENDLLILDLRDFDVILEMDWLSKHHACINYFHKIVTFQTKIGIECVFQGEWMVVLPCFIWCVMVDKMTKKGCMV